MSELSYTEIKKDVDLCQWPVVGVPWKGVSPEGHKEEWCKKGQIKSMPSRTEATVSLEGGGTLTVKLSVLRPWHESLETKRRTYR